MCQCFHCLAANVGTVWNGTNRSRSQAKIVDWPRAGTGPTPVLMLATARNERPPMVKNSASSPPGAGSADQGSKRPPAGLQQQQVGVAVAAVHPRRAAGDVPGELRDGQQVAACHRERGSTARAPDVGIRWISVRVDWHGTHYSNPRILRQQVIWSYYRRHAALMDVTFHVLDVRKLIMLEAVMAEGSIAAAAGRLQYTRSAVSQQISALEAEAGTAAGRPARQPHHAHPGRPALVEHAERILVELRSAEATLAGATRRSPGCSGWASRSAKGRRS